MRNMNKEQRVITKSLFYNITVKPISIDGGNSIEIKSEHAHSKMEKGDEISNFPEKKNNESECSKVDFKKSFICYTNSCGGPFYSSDYVAEHENGGSLLYRSAYDSFEPPENSFLFIAADNRRICFCQFKNLLFVLIGDSMKCPRLFQSIYKRQLNYCYNHLLCIMFPSVVHGNAFTEYNLTNIIRGSENMIKNLFKTMNNDIGFIFDSVTIKGLPPKILQGIHKLIQSELKPEILFILMTYKDQLILSLLNDEWVATNMDIVFILNLINSITPSPSPQVSYCVPLVLPSHDPNLIYTLYITQPDINIPINMAIITPQSDSDHLKILSDAMGNIFTKMINERYWFPVLSHLCTEDVLRLDVFECQHLLHFVYVYKQKLPSQIFMPCLADTIYNTPDGLRKLKEMYIYMTDLCENSWSLASRTSSVSLFYRKYEKPNSSLYIIMELAANIKNMEENEQKILNFFKKNYNL